MKKQIIICSIIVLSGITSLCAEEYDLKKFPKGSTPQEVGERLGWRYVRVGHSQSGRRIHTAPPRQLAYSDICTWIGALRFAQAADNRELYQALSDRFDRFMWSESYLMPAPNHVDHNVFGVIPLELYLHGRNKEHFELGMKYADTQWDIPGEVKPEEKAWADRGYSWQTRLWIDDMFMITAIQTQAYAASGDKKYADRAAREMVLYLDSIQRPNGLFYHTPETPFFWARGNGWMAVGMADLLRQLPEDSAFRPRIMESYKRMMRTLCRYQAEDGMWRQLIDEPDAWKETSGTAMFTYALITGVKHGWLDAKEYGAAARKAWLTLVNYIDRDDNVTEVCGGTNATNNKQFYLDRRRIVGDMHGQAPVLWCAYALVAF